MLARIGGDLMRRVALLAVAILTGACAQPAAYPSGYALPAQDSCTAGASVTYYSDKTYSITGYGECMGHRRVRAVNGASGGNGAGAL